MQQANEVTLEKSAAHVVFVLILSSVYRHHNPIVTSQSIYVPLTLAGIYNLVLFTCAAKKVTNLLQLTSVIFHYNIITRIINYKGYTTTGAIHSNQMHNS